MAILRVGISSGAGVLHGGEPNTPDVLLFPELFDGGYHALKHGMPPHAFQDDVLASLRDSTRTRRWTIVAGSTFLRENTHRPTNTSLVFRAGRIIHRYDKIHLFRPTGDTLYFSRGDRPVRVFTIPVQRGGIRAGVVICYDLRFPELMRVLATKGMQVLFVPARWPAARDDVWRSLLKARAIENQIFVVGCNAGEAEGGTSYAFDPLGGMIFAGKTRNEMKILTLDLRRLAEARKFHWNLKEAVFLRNRMKF